MYAQILIYHQILIFEKLRKWNPQKDIYKFKQPFAVYRKTLDKFNFYTLKTLGGVSYNMT